MVGYLCICHKSALYQKFKTDLINHNICCHEGDLQIIVYYVMRGFSISKNILLSGTNLVSNTHLSQFFYLSQHHINVHKCCRRSLADASLLHSASIFVCSKHHAVCLRQLKFIFSRHSANTSKKVLYLWLQWWLERSKHQWCLHESLVPHHSTNSQSHACSCLEATNHVLSQLQSANHKTKKRKNRFA